jgi:hypothetical protein
MASLRELAYVRSGDKGDIASVGVIARTPAVYERVVGAVAPERVQELLGDWVEGPIRVHRMDNVHAVMVVLHRGLGGGSTSTLRLDQTGKSLGTALLRLEAADG